MNLSPDWADYLTQAGFPAIHWSTAGDPRASDRQIMDWAIAHRYTILTHDLDFGAILALTRASGPSVIQLRGRDIFPSAAGPAVLEVLNRFGPELAAGALVTVDSQKRRVRLLPF